MRGSEELPIYKITVPITGSKLTLSTSGDFHYGSHGVNKDEILRVIKKEQEQHRGNIFRIYTGDMIENNLKNSVGHGYDMAEPDPSVQKDEMTEILTELNEHLYGKSVFQKLRMGPNNLKGCLSVGCCGNHEYRTRKEAGQKIDKDMFEGSKTLWIDQHAILELKLVNKKIRKSKTYKIYIKHRPTKSSSATIEGILRGCRKKRADIPGLDVYVYGHFHRRVIEPEVYYDNQSGKVKKALYVINPSPMCDAEYATVAGFSALEMGYHVNVYLPLDENKNPYGLV